MCWTVHVKELSILPYFSKQEYVGKEECNQKLNAIYPEFSLT